MPLDLTKLNGDQIPGLAGDGKFVRNGGFCRPDAVLPKQGGEVFGVGGRE